MNWNTAILVAGSVILVLAVGLMLTPIVTIADVPHVAVWLDVVHRVCTSIGGIGTFVALIFVARQFNLLRWQSELLQKNVVASMDSALYARLDSFNRFIVEHHKIYDLLNNPFTEQEPVEQRAKLHHLCDLGFTFYEEIFKHHVRFRLLDTEDWDEWIANLKHFFGKPYVRGYWKTVAGRFSLSFQKFINEWCDGLPESLTTPTE